MEVITFKYYLAKIFINKLYSCECQGPWDPRGARAQRAHDDTFPARFPNIFVDYPLGQMRVEDKL